MNLLRSIKLQFLLFTRFIWKWRATWLRGGLCFSIGVTTLILSYNHNYDLRFIARGKHRPNKDIVLIQIAHKEWNQKTQSNIFPVQAYNELKSIPDDYYWDTPQWKKLLRIILSQNPKAIGVTFYFSKDIEVSTQEFLQSTIFNNNKIYWAARLDREGRVLFPKLSTKYNRNVGLNEILADDDNLVRKFKSDIVQVPDLALKITMNSKTSSDYITGQDQFINFQGPKGSFKTLSLTEVLSPSFSKDFFQDKIVLIGSKDSALHNFQTPVGSLSRSEIMANFIDNFLDKKWIKRIPLSMAIILHLIVLIFSIYVISSYPQSVAFIFSFWIALIYSAASTWMFDSFYFWTPILSVLIQLFATFLIFISYKLTLKDYQNWQLEQERKSLMELEQLKHNFVSLFSHDLKTPIAKIQAICDRLTLQNPNSELLNDLKILRRESAELHRYIQSILQITKVESREFKLNKEAYDLNEIVENVIEQLQPLTEAKSHKLDIQLEPMFLIEIDPILIREVILNLVENAIKYTPNSGQIMISTSEKDNMVYFKIKDSGPGICELEQQKIFDKFYRTKEQQHNAKGSGLGLYLVKYFIELHGGLVFLNSKVDAGTEIGFSLPV